MHVHAFSPLEIRTGADTLGLSLCDYLSRLKDCGLASLPGTAAEILDDEVRAILCPDKINTAEWFEVMEAAHAVGLRSTATIMFGHVDSYRHWARHLLRIRALQERTGGFTEFVPLPFVHMEAPIYLKGQSRKGPTFREAVLMHAVARLVLDPVFANIQASWVKMGPGGCGAAARRRRQRSRRRADERVHHAGCRGAAWPGDLRRRLGAPDPPAGTHAAPAFDAVRAGDGRAQERSNAAAARSARLPSRSNSEGDGSSKPLAVL
jgi:hypothetical protein